MALSVVQRLGAKSQLHLPSRAFGADFRFGAAVLGLGLSSFGLVTGYWPADSSGASPAAAVSMGA